MRLFLFSVALTSACVIAVPAIGQSSRDALRVYNQQSGGPSEQRDWRTFKDFDYDRPEAGKRRYFANRYYRDYRYYAPIYLGAVDRVYRGSDYRYYCRRADGTTGLIAVGDKGGLLNNALRPGGSRELGAFTTADGKAAFGDPMVCH